MAELSSPRSSWLHPSPACTDTRPWPGTSCGACRRWCLQICFPFYPGSARTSPVAHLGVAQSQRMKHCRGGKAG